MSYIDSITFPDRDEEFDFFIGQKLTCYDSYYPFQVLSSRGLRRLDFEAVTVLCGGNGCGKTTALNVIAEKLGLARRSAFNRSPFFETYTDMCRPESGGDVPEKGMIITSDDIFDFMLDLRSINEGVDNDRNGLTQEYLKLRSSGFKLTSLADYDKLARVNTARGKTMSEFVRREGAAGVREHSNGETAYRYFFENITENGLYLLDEPENSLSAARQIELKGYIEDCAAYSGCQFVISTHSPFLLSVRNAKIYDMDADPPDIKKWTQLDCVRTYHDFFAASADEFGEDE